MRGVAWVVRKDLARFFADRQGAVMSVVVPVVLATFLGMLFAPRSSAGTLNLLVVDDDQSPASRALVAAIAADDTFVISEIQAADARAKLASGNADVALRIPPGGGAALVPTAMFTGNSASLELLFDPSDATEADITEGLLTKLVMEHTLGALGDRDALGGMFDDLVRDLPADADPALAEFLHSGQKLSAEPAAPSAGPKAGGLQAPVTFARTEVSAAGPTAGYNSYSHNFSGTLLLFLLFGAQSSARNLVWERESGALLRVRLAPVSPAHALLATGLASALIAALVSVAVYAVGMLIFGVAVLGSWPGFLGILAAQSLFVGSFALLLAGLGKTEAQISSVGTLAVLTMSFAGGAMFPSFMMPGWLQAVSQAIPTYWASRGLAAMTWRGLGWMDALPSIGVLLVFTLLFSAVGIRRFRWDA